MSGLTSTPTAASATCSSTASAICYDLTVPGGAFYLFPRLPWGTGMEFVARGIEKHQLLVIPGNVFSRRDTHFRISYAASDEMIARGIEALRKLAKEVYALMQGQWTEAEYLPLQERSRRLVELSNGQIEVLSTPSLSHQRIVSYFFLLLKACAAATRLGEVLFAPLPIRLWAGKYGDPDVVYLTPGHITDPHHQPQGADLVVEVVSETEEDRQRDLVTKRQEYAQAGIAEYWIVDPKTETIVVLTLDGTAYRLHGEFPLGTTATSVLLPTFTADVTAVFEAGRGPRNSQ